MFNREIPNDCKVDILIAGSGVAACSTAIAIKQLLPDLSVLMIEQNPPVNTDKSNHFRIGETLVPQAIVPLQQLGLWEPFTACEFMPAYGSSAAWGTDLLYHNEFVLSPYGNGWHLDRVKFDKMVLVEAEKKNVPVIFKSTVSTITKSEGWTAEVRQRISHNEYVTKTIKCRFLVDATGRRAGLAKKCGAAKVKVDQLISIYKFFKIKNSRTLNSASLVESFNNGWWYSSFLPDNNLVVALMTDADLAKKHSCNNDFFWQQHLMNTVHTKERLLHSDVISKIKVSAAHSQYLSQYSGDGWLAVGDAANCYDPLSSAGIFKALMMGRYASYAIADYFKGIDKKLVKYQSVVNSEYKKFLLKRETYYLKEKRFSNVFWNRRTGKQLEKTPLEI